MLCWNGQKDIKCQYEPRGRQEARCANGGECVDGLGESFTCVCGPGWTGDTCEVNIDECQEQPCLNDGHCIDLVGGFQVRYFSVIHIIDVAY